MAKPKNVTSDEITEVMSRVDDLIADLNYLADKIEKGYADPIESPMQKARMLGALARAALWLQAGVMVKAAMDEDRKELEALMRERVALEKNA